MATDYPRVSIEVIGQHLQVLVKHHGTYWETIWIPLAQVEKKLERSRQEVACVSSKAHQII